MNKSATLVFALFGVLLLSSLVQAEDATCATHTGWVKSKQLLKDMSANDPKQKANVDKLILDFEGQTPAVVDDEELGVCVQFTGQKTCCRKRMTTFLDRAVLLKAKPLNQKDNLVKKLLKYTLNKIRKTSCVVMAGMTKPATPEEIVAKLSSLPKTKALFDNSNNCKNDFSKAISAYTRGAVCVMCAGVDQLSNYFDAAGNVIVNQDSATKFEAATEAAQTCLTALLTEDNINAVVTEIGTYFLEAGSKCPSEAATNAMKAFNSNKIAGGKCKSKNVFSDNSACENSQQGNPDVDQAVKDSEPARLLRNFEDSVQKRILDDTVLDATKGINVFIKSPADSDITADGNMDLDATVLADASSVNIKYSIMFIMASLIALI